ncbi:MAG: hypothetical protein HY850_06720 [Betaproteobacteria bacterium]|nr:hypothetical protein [Betaproteobacteria bacterium]
MNQVFTKKKLAAALTLAFATGGAAVLTVAPVPGLVAAAQANQFADTTLAVGTTAGVSVPKGASVALTGQTIAITENVTGALSTGQIVLTPSAGKFVSASGASTNSLVLQGITVDSSGNLIVPISTISSGGASTISLSSIVMDTSSLSVGTAITVTVSTSSTVTGLTKGVSATIANVTAVGATVKATATTTPTYGKLGATTIVNTIEVAETILGSIKDSSSATDEITVTLPSGFNFVSGGATGGTDTIGTGGGAGTNDGAITNNVIKYDVTGTGTTASAGKVVLANTNWVVYIPSSAADGNVDATVAVKLSDGTVHTSTVTLFKVASAGTTNSAYTTATTTAPTTFPTFYAGRATQNSGLDVAVRENVGSTLLPGGTVSLTFPTGVTAGKDYTATEVTVDATGIPNAVASVTDSAGTASEDGKGSIMATLNATDANTTAGKVTFKLDDIDLADTAATGDLNVTVGGSAGATAGTVKIGSVIAATTTTPGAGSTVTAGSTLTLPEIVMVENKAGALVGGAALVGLYIANANGAAITTTGATVKAYKADGTDISSTIFGSANGATLTASVMNGLVTFPVTTASSTSTGAVTIKINGLKATLLSTATAGDVTAVIGGASATNDTTPTSDEGAKAFKQTITIGKIVAAAVPSIPAATVTGAVTSQTITGSAVAAGNDQGKLGTLYIAAVLPASQGSGVFLKNSSGNWVAYNPASPAYYASPVTLGTHALSVVSALDLSGIVGTKIYGGYGVGVTDFGVTGPWNAMISNGTYNLIHTVAQ